MTNPVDNLKEGVLRNSLYHGRGVKLEIDYDQKIEQKRVVKINMFCYFLETLLRVNMNMFSKFMARGLSNLGKKFDTRSFP